MAGEGGMPPWNEAVARAAGCVLRGTYQGILSAAGVGCGPSDLAGTRLWAEAQL